MSTDERVTRLERLVLNLGETVQSQQIEIRELQAELGNVKVDAEIALKKLGL